MTTDANGRLPRHVAIIMDGNGRWATRRGLPRVAGHRHGVEAVRSVARKARDLGIEYLTLYSFSTENWSRPRTEVGELFSLLKHFIRRDLAELHHNNVVVKVIGERDGVPADVLKLLDEAERLTAGNSGQKLVIAFNYGSRHEITTAVRRIAAQAAEGKLDPASITQDLISANLDTAGIPDPDLIIRTSGEQRLSNFLMWQAAYSEFVFTDTLWPDFGPAEFEAALQVYAMRRRRFGGLEADPTRVAGS
ncbi:MAG: isoprenyl transferase [Nitratireductor sp.]|jgi:undecaprenyl diphosphate synthase|nr:isoprenyl transferase [Nitratireductor sp.]